MDLSIIIVSYNTAELTLQAITSVIENTSNIDYEIIVVDNNSTDNTCTLIEQVYKDVKIIKNSVNVGFGAANNQAAIVSRGEYLLLLNSDTRVIDSSIENLLSFAQQHPAYMVYGGRTLFADGSLNPSSCWGTPTIWSQFCRAFGLSTAFKRCKLFNPESLGNWQRDSASEVPIISGCFMMLLKATWNSLKGFDECFSMYAEDFDLCIRVREGGGSLIIDPGSVIIHYGGSSESDTPDKTIKHLRAKVLLFRKHWPGAKSISMIALLRLWVFNKMCQERAQAFTSMGVNKEFGYWEKVHERRAEWCGAGVRC